MMSEHWEAKGMYPLLDATGRPWHLIDKSSDLVTIIFLDRCHFHLVWRPDESSMNNLPQKPDQGSGAWESLGPTLS